MYDADGASGALSAALSATMGAAIGAFAGAAANGMVAIDPDAAQAALTEIGNVRIEIENLLSSAGMQGVEVSIGANPVGEAMALKSMNRYQGSGDSFTAVLQKLLGETQQAESALKQAIANYQHTDHGNAVKYGG